MHKQSHQNTHPTFTYRKGRIFYFRRKIPSDLRCHYKRPVFVQSLRTTSRSSAQKAATILSARLDEQWLMLRIKHNQSPASQLLVEAEYKSELPLISEILERYLDTKGHGKLSFSLFTPSATLATSSLLSATRVLISIRRQMPLSFGIG